MAASKPRVSFSEDEHKYEFLEEGVVWRLRRFYDSTRDGLKCEITITGTGGLIKPPSTTNLLSEQTVTKLAENLAKTSDPTSTIDWRAMMTLIAYQSVERYRAGDPPIALASVSGWKERPRYLLYPFIGSSGDTVVFAHGGTGKSMFALLCAVQVATGIAVVCEYGEQARGNVLYCDWEADEHDHAERLHAILRGFEPTLELPSEEAIMYKRMRASLADSVDELRAVVLKHNIKMIIVDSIGKARGGNPNDPEETLKVFNALRRIGVPSLVIDHMSKESFNNGNGNTMPIGTVYTHNSARLTWGMAVPDTIDDSNWTDRYSTTSVVLTNQKNNNGRLHKRLGLDLSYHTDERDRLEVVYVNSFDPANRRGFLSGLKLWEKCKRMLEEQGPATAKQLAAWLNAKSGEVDRVLLGQPSTFVRDGETWSIIAAEGNVPASSQDELPWFMD